MNLSDDDLVQIEEKSSTLQERLTGGFDPIVGHTSKASRRLARWRHLAADDDPEKFLTILAASGLDRATESAILPLLGEVKKKPGTPPAPWALLLRALVRHLATLFTNGAEAMLQKRGQLGRNANVPFEHLLWPVADFAWHQVEQTHRPGIKLLTKRATEDLKSQLVHRLAAFTSAPLLSAFAVHRAFHNQETENPNVAKPRLTGQQSDEAQFYRSFVHNVGCDGLRGLFRRHPVLARLVAEGVGLWVGMINEFLERLQGDWLDLSSHFNQGRVLPPVSRLKAGMSDPHNGGQTVMILTFASILSIVYKPRSMAVDHRFFDLVAGLNAAGMTPRLRVLKILARGEYGWMEYVKPRPCANEVAANRFYQRSGALVGLIHWLDGIDCHHENVIAAGEHPVLIDLETLAHPFHPIEQKLLGPTTTSALADSVLRSGLLPLWLPCPSNKGKFDNSGLAAPIRQRALIPTDKWVHVNTDQMDKVSSFPILRRVAHRARLNGKLLAIKDFTSDVLLGYRRFQRVIAGKEAGKLQVQRSEIQSSVRRHVMRPTLAYGVLMRQSLDLACLAEGIDRSIELQVLPLVEGQTTQRNSEITQLERLDIPYFQIDTPTRNGEQPRTDLNTALCALEHEEQIRLSLSRKLMVENGEIHHCTPALPKRSKPVGRSGLSTERL